MRTIQVKTLAMVFLALLLSGGSAFAQQTKQGFTAERFAALQQEGALILVDVFADWCSTCARQQRVLSEFREMHPDVPLHTLTVDFDSQKQYVRQFRAPRQSTFILFRGSERIWFSVAETDRDRIFAELNRAASTPVR
jgi:thiol-disulfide isomerase/thioredoxin